MVFLSKQVTCGIAVVVVMVMVVVVQHFYRVPTTSVSARLSIFVIEVQIFVSLLSIRTDQ